MTWRATRGPHPRDERGMAMILVIGVAAIFMATALLAVQLADVSIGSSAGHVTHEQELHLAENGIDQVLARVQRDELYTTPCAPAALPAGAAPDVEEAWALAALEAAVAETAAGCADQVQDAPGGSFVAVKPTGRNVVYAAGWNRARSGPAEGRLLKAEYLFSTYHPEAAIITGGDLIVSGNADVGGQLGDIHANGDLSFVGASPTVSGAVTASGTITNGSGVGTSQTAGAPQRTLPSVDPDEMWELLSGEHSGAWYDLCSDGTARRPTGAAPCLGEILWDAQVNNLPFRGWQWKSMQQEWEKDGSGEYDGVYFVDGATVSITKNPGTLENPWRATVITRAPELPGTCQIEVGDILVGGTPVMRGYIDGLVFAAARDLKVTGNSNQSFTGVMAAHEQIYVSGNPTLYGSILAESACDSDGSPVEVSEISGSMIVRYDDDLDVQVGNLIRTSLWLEL